MTRALPRLALLAPVLLALGAGTAGAVPIYLGLDSALSSVAPAGGPAAPLSGYLRVDAGSLPPNTQTVTFDLLDVAVGAVGQDLSIRLDPAFANPGAGVVNAAGTFLIPNVHVLVDSGGIATPLTLVGVTGTFDPGDTCDTPFCLDVQLAIATGPAPSDVISVVIHAPEPSTCTLLAAALLAGCAAGRSREVRA